MRMSGDRSITTTSAGNASAAASTPGKATRVQLLAAEDAGPAPRAARPGAAPGAPPSVPASLLQTAFGPAVQAKDALEGAPAAVEHEEDFKPATGTKETPLKGTYGDFKVKHGLTKVPSKGELGEYSVEIEMTPNKATGASRVGFMQTVRSANAPGTAWHTKGTDPGMTPERAKRTDPKTGWRVDRADPSGDKTPFYGMFKDDKGKINQYTTARVGTFGGATAKLEDAPSVADPRTREFVATAKDMSDGKEFGAVHWGFGFDSASKTSTEVTPALLDAAAPELKGRDAAVDKWNTVVATDGSGIDKVPGK
jgi:hypothetical protein